MSQTARPAVKPEYSSTQPLKHSNSFTAEQKEADPTYPPLQPKIAFSNTSKSPQQYLVPTHNSAVAPSQHSYDTVAAMLSAYNMQQSAMPQQPIAHTSKRSPGQPLILHSIACQTELQRANRAVNTDLDQAGIAALLDIETTLNEKYDTMYTAKVNDITLLNKQLSESQLLLDNVEHELAALKEASESAGLSTDSLAHQLGNMTQQYNTVCAQLTDLTKHYNIANNKAKLLETTLVSLDKNNKKVLLYVDNELNTKLNTMHAQLDAFTIKYFKLFEYYTSLLKDSSDLKALQQQHAEQQKQLEQLRVENNELKLANDSLQQQLDKANAQILDLQNAGCCAKCCTIM